MSFGSKSAGDKGTAAWANLIEDALGDGNPAQMAGMVVFKDGSTYYARNGKDGTIDYNGTNAADVITSAFTDVKVVYVQEGAYAQGSTSITMSDHGQRLLGPGADFSGVNGAIFTYTGTAAAIEIVNAGTRLQNCGVSDLGIIASGSAITSATAYGIHATGVEHFTLDNVMVRDFEVSTGIKISASATIYSALIKMMFPITHECKYGIYVDGVDATHETNCVDIYSPLVLGKAGPTAGSMGIGIGDYSTCNRVFGGDIEIYESGIYHSGDYCSFYGTRTESIGTTHIAVQAAATDNYFYNHKFVGGGTKVSDGGTNTRFTDCHDYVTANSGSSSIDNGQTTKVVAHGLSVTPLAEHFTIIGKENPTNDVGTIWIDTIGAANFTVNVEADPGASNWDFGWKVIVI